MRRFLVVGILPLMFGLVPALAGAAVVAALPPVALEDYLMRIRTSPIDWLILGLGATLFSAQTLLSIRAMRWRETGFNEGPDRWLAYLAQGAEWFPLLGLLGTVAGILQTFSSINGPVTPQEIIRKYAPAITATGSGLFMALLNILPIWVVNVGRDLILALAGGPSSRGE